MAFTIFLSISQSNPINAYNDNFRPSKIGKDQVFKVSQQVTLFEKMPNGNKLDIFSPLCFAPIHKLGINYVLCDGCKQILILYVCVRRTRK
jgi:hypothetical protein